MSQLSASDWRRLNELRRKKNKTPDEMAELTTLQCKQYGMCVKPEN